MANEVKVILLPLKGGHPPAVEETEAQENNDDLTKTTQISEVEFEPAFIKHLTLCHVGDTTEVKTQPLSSRSLPSIGGDKMQITVAPFKAGGRRVSKKQENAVVERNAKKGGSEKTSALANVAKVQSMIILNDTLEKISHKFPAAVQVAHQKPRPGLEKTVPQKRIYIIQQPRKC